jgi:hypothetical protein
MRNGHRISYEKAETAKMKLMELMDELLRDNAPIKEVEQLDTIVSKLEVWQNKYSV